MRGYQLLLRRNNPNVLIQAVTNIHTKTLSLIVEENISKAKEISVVKPTNGVIEVYYKSTFKILRVKAMVKNQLQFLI